MECPDTRTSPLPDAPENLGSYVGPSLDREVTNPNHPCSQQLGDDVIDMEDCLKVRVYSTQVAFENMTPSAPAVLYAHGSLFVAGDAWAQGAFSGELLIQFYNVLVLGAQY